MIKATIKALFWGVVTWILLSILIFFGTGVYSGIVTQDSTAVVSGALVSILRYTVLLLALGTFVYVFLQERKKRKTVIVTEKKPTIVEFSERAPTIGSIHPPKPVEPRLSPPIQPTFRPPPSPQPTPPPRPPQPPVQPTPPAGGPKPPSPSLPQSPQPPQPTPPPRSPQPSQPFQPKPPSPPPPQNPQPSQPSSTLPGFRGMPSQSQDQSRYIK